MIPDISNALSWLEANRQILNGINRGIERETLRITPEGKLATTPFPTKIGSALTHRWITTDFAEAMLEFITPVGQSVDTTLLFLRDLHRYTVHQIGDELIWPLSMPCYFTDEQDVILAQYGSSNVGKMKTLYRQGLKERYGSFMQTISGVHYNFSLPLSFWQKREGVTDEKSGKDKISAGYFRTIRNYYRFGWVIPYLFGTSPFLCPSFIKDKQKQGAFEKLSNGNCYLPYATSLRLSDLGYTNSEQKDLDITFNDLATYVKGLKAATKLRSEKFAKIGVKVDGEYRQINDHVLQIENEFYAPIRPKNTPKGDEYPSDALFSRGVQYIEIRSLDVNPFTPIGITEEQVRFLDLFLIWCTLADAPEMSAEELNCTKLNWNRVILEGRKPEQTIGIGCDSYREPLSKVGKNLFADLFRIADVLDSENNSMDYRLVGEKLVQCFDDPQLTLSGRLLQMVKNMGSENFGLALAKQYKQLLLGENLQLLTPQAFSDESKRSIHTQQQIEQSDAISFEQYLYHHTDHEA